MNIHARAIARASALAHDPSLAVIRALVDDPIFADWAAPEALRLLGAPRTPGEVAGRLVVVAWGPDAERMANGAAAVFGEAVDELMMVGGERETTPAVQALVGALGRDDRLLLLHSPPRDPDRSAPDRSGLGRSVGIGEWAAWAAPARVVCLSLVDDVESATSFGVDNLEFRVIETGGGGTAAALAEARVRGLDTTLLSTELTGDPSSLGRALAHVGRAIGAGLGGLVPPACAIASGRVRGGDQRHQEVVEAAAHMLGPDSSTVTVECWSPGPRAPDLFAVLVAPNSGG